MDAGAPIVRDVVLVGGGHAHALLIRRWAMRPLAGVRLTLVSEDARTPYSGMLPGLVAGHYTVDEVHIDLLRLCAWAGVRFIEARMTGIDPEAREVALRGRPAIGYDLLSLDTGSTPDLSVPGAREHAVPVKPVHDFHARWLATLGRVRARDGDEPFELGVLGSGAGGFEIMMAARFALPRERARVHWFLRGDVPLAGRARRAGELALRAAEDAGVTIHRGFDASEVRAGPLVVGADGRETKLDELLWCTGATGPDWPAAAGLETDEKGFVATDAYLRSRTYPDVFAVGDIGTQIDSPAPKAGVHAVRQAPVLHRNLRAALLGEAPKPYRPQSDFLSLMAIGRQHGIASRGPFTLSGDWTWRWKDRIDRRFMDRFAELPTMRTSGLPSILPDALLDSPSAGSGDGPGDGPGDSLRCRGCGAKIGARLLDEVLGELAPGPDDGVEQGAGVVVGLGGPGGGRDAAVLDSGDALLVQSVDQLSAIVDDPWLFGRIATLHALGDVIVLDATPHSAQVTLTLPPGSERVQRRELRQLMGGIVAALAEAGVTLVGGHTAEGAELQVGLTLNAFAPRHGGPRAPELVDARPGDRLILTRPIGVGLLFAGLMRRRARGEQVGAALRAMARPQQAVADSLRERGARAMTDVTGFGLAGHLDRLLRPSALHARLEATAVPVLAGARELAEAGVRSSLHPKNVASLERFEGGGALPRALRVLLADPQTAGGLLAVMPEARADEALATIRSMRGGAPEAAIVGTLERRDAHRVV